MLLTHTLPGPAPPRVRTAYRSEKGLQPRNFSMLPVILYVPNQHNIQANGPIRGRSGNSWRTQPQRAHPNGTGRRGRTDASLQHLTEYLANGNPALNGQAIWVASGQMMAQLHTSTLLMAAMAASPRGFLVHPAGGVPAQAYPDIAGARGRGRFLCDGGACTSTHNITSSASVASARARGHHHRAAADSTEHI